MMQGIKLAAAAFAAACMLAGCSAPKYKEIEAKYAGLPPDTGRIYFYQPAQASNAVSAHPYLRINDWKAGRSIPGSFFFVNRPAGTYTISTLTDKENAIKFTLAAGQTRYVRIDVEGVSGNATGVGEQVMREEPSAAKAKEEMANLKYNGAGSRERKSLRRTYPIMQ